MNLQKPITNPKVIEHGWKWHVPTLIEQSDKKPNGITVHFWSIRWSVWRWFRLRRLKIKIFLDRRKRARIKRFCLLKYGIDPFFHIEKRRALLSCGAAVNNIDEPFECSFDSVCHGVGVGKSVMQPAAGPNVPDEQQPEGPR